MKNQWTTRLMGYVKIKIEGKSAERLLNRLIRENVSIWNVKRVDTKTLHFSMKLSDITYLRKAARNSGNKVRFIGRKGLPFLALRLKKYSGLLFGIVLFFCILFLLSNMVWGINIEGATPATEHLIRKKLDQMDIKIGRPQFVMENVETIQRNITDSIKNVTWVGVELKGTTYSLHVVEKKLPKKQANATYHSLIASKKAVITQTMVEKGQVVVEKHQYVKKGQMLVSGNIGLEGKQTFVGAKGKILAETWYKTEVVVPLSSSFSVFTGVTNKKQTIGIGSLEVPVSGFRKPDFSKYEVEKQPYKWKIGKWTVPISYNRIIYRQKEAVLQSYSVAEAIKKGLVMGRQDLRKMIPADAAILHENILQNNLDNGKVKLTIHYQVIENIAVGQPITQGD